MLVERDLPRLSLLTPKEMLITQKANCVNYVFLCVYLLSFIAVYHEECPIQTSPEADQLAIGSIVYTVSTLLLIINNMNCLIETHEINLSISGVMLFCMGILRFLVTAFDTKCQAAPLTQTSLLIVRWGMFVHVIMLFDIYSEMYLYLLEYCLYRRISEHSSTPLPFSLLDLRGHVTGGFYQTTFRLKQLLRFVPRRYI
jgi:hypothetical protein